MTGGTAPLLPGRGSDLTDGIVVRTQLLGRVLGIRLLRVDGTVLVSPARPAPARVNQPSAAVGTELAEAARLLHESDRVLRRRPPAGVS